MLAGSTGTVGRRTLESRITRGALQQVLSCVQREFVAGTGDRSDQRLNLREELQGLAFPAAAPEWPGAAEEFIEANAGDEP